MRRSRARVVAVALVPLLPLIAAAADPPGDVAPCGGGVQGSAGTAPIDVVAASATVVELGTAVEFRITFAESPPAPDPVGRPWRVDVVLRDPTLPDYSFGFYRNVNRLVRFDATRVPKIDVLLLPERGRNEYFAVRFEGDELVMRIPGRLLVRDEDLEGVPLGRLRWGAIVRDEASCDSLGRGRPTRRIVDPAGGTDRAIEDPVVPAPTLLPEADASGGRTGRPFPVWPVALGLVLAVGGLLAWLGRRRV